MLKLYYRNRFCVDAAADDPEKFCEYWAQLRDRLAWELDYL